MLDPVEQRAEQHRAADRERLRERERLEQPARLILEREDRQETDHGGGGGREQRPGDFLRGVDHGGGDLGIERRTRHRAALGAATLLQVDEVLRDVFGHDDPEIDHHPDRDRDAGEAHDVGADPSQVHHEKREEHAQRQGDGDREAGADV